MRRIAIGWVLALCVLSSIAGARVAADAIPPPPTCPAWQEVQWRASRHSGADCVARACTRSAECGGGACAERRACMAERERWIQQGPCLDRDGDDVCDNRRRITETVEVGPCGERGACGEGRCVTRHECTPPPIPPG